MKFCKLVLLCLAVFLPIALNAQKLEKTVIFPQFVIGGGWTTAFDLTNLSSLNANGTMKCFDDAGRSLTFSTDQGNVGGTTPLSVSIKGSLAINPSEAASLSGWCKVEADQRFTGQAILRFNGGSTTAVEGVTAVTAATLRVHHSVTPSYQIRSGIALVNPNANSVVVTASLVTDTGARVGTTTISLDGMQHRSSFVGDSGLFQNRAGE